MHSSPAPYRSPRSQRGAALVVGMLLLLVLTLLAISGMNTASLELVMAGNTQYRQNAFQAAENGIERSLQEAAFNPGAAPETVQGVAQNASFVAITSPQLNGAALPALWGSSLDSFSTYHFEIESTGTSHRNAVAINRQGVAVVAPQDSTVFPLDPTGSTELN